VGSSPETEKARRFRGKLIRIRLAKGEVEPPQQPTLPLPALLGIPGHSLGIDKRENKLNRQILSNAKND
jgi:hypothetical protein